MNPLSIILAMAVLCFSLPTFGQAPLNDIVLRRTLKARPVLKPAAIREADLFWEKRISRVIDTKQKQNLPFMYPAAPFFHILKDGAEGGQIKLYSDANFETELSSYEGIFYEIDTITTLSADYVENIRVVKNTVSYEQIHKYRLHESWYFNEASSTMQVQILGIAPIKTRFDEQGNSLYEHPLFWIHFPSAQKYLASHKINNNHNDAALMSWDDLFQMRQFASNITKQSNVRDNRLKDIYPGIELLQESDKIKQELQNYEHDLWSY